MGKAVSLYMVEPAFTLPSFVYELSHVVHTWTYASEPHYHPGYELILCISGYSVLQFGGTPVLITPGTITIFPGHVRHSIAVIAPPYRRWLLHIEPRSLPVGRVLDRAKNPVQHGIETKAQMQLLLLFQQLRTSLDLGPLRWSGDAVQDRVTQIFRTVSYWSRRSDRPQLEQLNGDHEAQVIAAVIQAVHGRLPRVSVRDIAAFVNYSESHLRRLFRSRTGVSISDYIRMQRLERAQQLLLDDKNDVPVSAISRSLGFKEVGHFSRYFRQHTNLTPLQYRQLGSP